MLRCCLQKVKELSLSLCMCILDVCSYTSRKAEDKLKNVCWCLGDGGGGQNTALQTGFSFSTLQGFQGQTPGKHLYPLSCFSVHKLAGWHNQCFNPLSCLLGSSAPCFLRPRAFPLERVLHLGLGMQSGWQSVCPSIYETRIQIPAAHKSHI